MQHPYGATADNYDITFVAGTIRVNKVDVTLTAPTAISGLEYTGDAQTLINAGSVTGGNSQAPKKLHFVFDKENSTTNVETITNDPSPITNKSIEEGHLIIIRDGVKYNAPGQIVK